MSNMFYKAEFAKCYCCCTVFVVNDIVAVEEDFGEKYDRDELNAEPYGCGDMRFTRHTDEAKISRCLEKYRITRSQFHTVAAALEKGLSFGDCNWCV